MSPEGCVIIVDDDDAVRQSLTFSLALEGFQVRAFRNGEELLAEGELPARACMVIDHCMPSLDGLTLIGRLRQSAIALPAILIAEKASAEFAVGRRCAAAARCWKSHWRTIRWRTASGTRWRTTAARNFAGRAEAGMPSNVRPRPRRPPCGTSPRSRRHRAAAG